MEAWLYVWGGVVFEWGVAFQSVGAGLCECEGVALGWGRGLVSVGGGFLSLRAWLVRLGGRGYERGAWLCIEGGA